MWDQLTAFVQEQIQTNDLFKGGLLLMAGGALLALVRQWPRNVWSFIKRQSMIEIDIPDKDPAFKWVDMWLAQHSYSKNRARLLTVKSEREGREYNKLEIFFSPAPGTHYLWYKRRFIMLTRNRQKLEMSASGVNYSEFFTLRILGRRRDIARSLIEEAYEMSNPDTLDKITVHRSQRYGEWRDAAPLQKRPLESVILPEGVSEHIIRDFQTFLDSEDWYGRRGIPYRRGYLLYGPPGNGKTSAIIAIASHFGLDIGMLNLKSGSLNDDDVCDALSYAPPHSIIVMEDIDCLINGRKLEDSGSTFSGLLNALDGISAAHGQIVFMTTNFRDKLDEALIRPGRCDVQVALPDANTYQKVKLFERFFGDSDLAVEFSAKAPSKVSMATLQSHLMQYRDDPQAACNLAVDIMKDAQ